MQTVATITAAVIRVLLCAALIVPLALAGCSQTAKLRLIGALSYAKTYASEPSLIVSEFRSHFASHFALETVPARALIEDIASGRVEGSCVRDVPFYMQSRYGCGAAALAGTLSYYGASDELAEIAHQVVVPGIGGTRLTDMIDYPRMKGLWSEEPEGSVELLRSHLAAGRPVICLLGTGLPFAGHYITVTACAPGSGVVCHNGYKPDVFMSWRRFSAFWDASGRCMLIVCPLAAVDWPLSADLRNEFGRVLHRVGEWEKALKEYEAALKHATTASVKARRTYNVGLAHFALGRFDKAQAAFLQALELDPELSDAANALAYSYATQGGNLGEAEALARRALAIERGKIEKLEEAKKIARSLLATRGMKPEKADSVVERIIAGVPDNTALCLDTLGLVLHRMGRDEEAMRVLREALEKAPADDRELLAEIHYHLGLASAADPKAREKSLKKAVELAPRSIPGRQAAALLDSMQKARKPR